MGIIILIVQFRFENAFEMGKCEIIFAYRKNTFYVSIWTRIFKNYYSNIKWTVVYIQMNWLKSVLLREDVQWLSDSYDINVKM